MRWSRVWAVTMLVSACATAPAPRVAAPTWLDAAALRAYAVGVAGTWMRTHAPQELPFRWGEGVLAFGLWRLHETFDDYEARAYVAPLAAAAGAALTSEVPVLYSRTVAAVMPSSNQK